MAKNSSPGGDIKGIQFALATQHEIQTASMSNSSIPLMSFPGELCTLRHEKSECKCCSGYIQLPLAVYHTRNMDMLMDMLNQLCLKCLNIKDEMSSSGKVGKDVVCCCEVPLNISVRRATLDDDSNLELVQPPSLQDDCWNFLERFGYIYGTRHTRYLLAGEVREILKCISNGTRNALQILGHNPLEVYIIEFLPVPIPKDDITGNLQKVPSVPYVSTTMFADTLDTELKEVLKQVEAIKSSINRFERDQTVATKMCRLVDAYLLAAAAKVSVKPTNLRVKARVEPGDSLVRARSKSISKEEVLEEALVHDKMNPLRVFAHGGTDIQSLFVEEEGEKYYASIGVHSKCKVAVKRSYKRDGNSFVEFSNQLECSKESTYVLRVIDYMYDEKFSYLVMEHAPCTLKDVGKKRTDRNYQPTHMDSDVEFVLNAPWDTSSFYKSILNDIVNGVADVHKKKIIHGSLDPDSVKLLVRDSTDVKAKISGFERSKYLRAPSNSLLFHYDKKTMASRWLAPEQILGNGESQASDCFNLGGLLYYVVKSRHPYIATPKRPFHINIKQNTHMYVNEAPDVAVELLDLINRLMEFDVQKRLTARQAVKHPFFWPSSKRMEFLTKVQQRTRNHGMEMANFRKHMQKNAFVILAELDKPVKDYFIKKLGFNYFNTSTRWKLMDMVRNLQVHYRDALGNVAVKKLMSIDNEDGILEYFDARYPDMLLHIYKYIEVHHSHKADMKQFF